MYTHTHTNLSHILASTTTTRIMCKTDRFILLCSILFTISFIMCCKGKHYFNIGKQFDEKNNNKLKKKRENND